MQSRNLILAIVLSLGFLFFWSMVIVPRLTPPAPKTAPVSAGSVQPVKGEQMRAAHAPFTQRDDSADHVFRDAENDIVIASRGGAIRHWRMTAKGQEADLVLHPEGDILPLESFPAANFKVSVEGRQAVMQATLDRGVRLVKTLRLAEEGHLHTLTYRFSNPTGQPFEVKNWEWGWGPGLGTTQMELKENAAVTRALSMGRLHAAHIKEGDHPEFGKWVGMDNRYFLVAFLPKSAHNTSLDVAGKKEASRLRLLETLTVPAHGETILEYELYVGPKGFTQLKKYEKGLEESVDFGWFTSIGRWLLRALYALHGFTGNYGMAIIIMTLCINVLLLPLTIKSFKATMAMKVLQPKIADLQKRFKDDPKRLNVEMMHLYKNSGANPLGGCLPMVLQIPIFVAFFNTLRNAYELRGAPFVLWVQDLSTPDKFPGLPWLHVLPLIMGAGMFLQQRMAGAVTDPMQKQMMMIMPVMFTFMLYSMPSGLVIYWLTNSMAMMTFQYIFNRTHMPQGVGTPESPIIEKR